MYEIEKIIVFLFVVILLLYMIRLSFFTRREWGLETHTFKVLFIGVLLITIATFFDMLSPMINTKFIHIFMKICFTLGAVVYIVGIILWSDYTKKVIKKFEELAIRDPMTGVFNRKGMEKVYKVFFEENSPFCLVICDLDKMKEINDEYGHLEGDKYIVGTSKIILDIIKGKGYVGRIGGDEFVIILEYEDIQQIQEIIFTIKQSVHEILHEKNTGISLGYSLFPNDGDTLEDLIKVADERMYNDKGSRKNYFK
ncbi:GGDEF domain-containing protein [Clostridium sp. MB40-C1]|uniref:GGDEF domain-containing protein n=1 Tax=Clostridium sp. MB40-C1 TaxID=3070996 RepID=UPI0027DF82E4|nr:GGDEF domain-containing protein [Clostridium sp. MB40-C1]WMJ80539.1 GGDEF domain-containing protein [Clostridium sp. MB40-C1]